MEELLKERNRLMTELNQLVMAEWRMEQVKKKLVEVNLKMSEIARLSQSDKKKQDAKKTKKAKKK